MGFGVIIGNVCAGAYILLALLSVQGCISGCMVAAIYPVC